MPPSSNEPFLPLLVPMMGRAAPTKRPVALADRVEAHSEDFEDWWRRWGALLPERRVAKGHARLAYARARTKAPAADLLHGAERYAALIRAEGRPARLIKHPATWLNGECWTDETGDGGYGQQYRAGGTWDARRGIDAQTAAFARASARHRDRNPVS